jgi:glucose-1-phosphate thymidylyltransferase
MLPWSKEILPIPVAVGSATALGSPAGRLLRQLALAGVRRALVVLDEQKWDVARHLGDGREIGVDLAYLTIRRSPSTPVTVDRAFEHIRDARVAFGFPDILLRPDDAFSRLLQRLEDTGADVVLGLFPADRPDKVDMVDADDTGRIRRITIKPERTQLELAWVAAVWAPTFTAYLHDCVAADNERVPKGRELYVGDVVQAAVDDGLHVDSAAFPEGAFLDVGTPEDLLRALREQW